VVTGGSGDLGAAVLPRLVRDYRCVAPYRSEAARAKLPDRVVALPDLSRLEGPVFALVHLAGGFAAGSSVEQFQMMIETNLMSAVHAVNAVLPHIEDRGRIVTVSSAVSLTRPSGLAAYTASKAALNAYVETLAKDLKDRSITVNALLPTNLDSPANQKDMPAERLVKRSNVAEMIALLLSDQATNISGQLIGMSA
jgi:NAD(P)-dependent dehydrogenase (short-subunit alcohol dehydrogenase family)